MSAPKSGDPITEKELGHLLDLLKTPVSELQNDGDSFSSPSSHLAAEAHALEQFSCKYKSCRNFKHLPQYLHDIFHSLVKKRLCNHEWRLLAPPENLLPLLVSLRILMRDSNYQTLFFELDATTSLAQILKDNISSYLEYGERPFVRDILKEITSIFHKLSTTMKHRSWLLAADVHKSLVILISFPDLLLIHCSLHALITLAKSPELCQQIGKLNTVETILKIIEEYDGTSKKLASNLLRLLLCDDPQSREMVKNYDGIPILLSQFHNSDTELQWEVVWCLVKLSEQPDARHEIKQLGGIPLLLSLLHCDTSHNSQLHNAKMLEMNYSLKSACCAALTELVLNDTNAHQIVQANGIYILGQLILPRPYSHKKEGKAIETLQKNSFRTLRFLFSVERNRRLFKRLFPSELYEMFIDVGHYNKYLVNYQRLVEKISSLPPETIQVIKNNVLETDQNKKPDQYIGDYAVFELLGSGGFGSVYKVKKTTAGQSFLAMKEINIESPLFGKNETERCNSLGAMISELNIIREQLRHPNIVRYYKTFKIDLKLYIVMELIEGAPLKEHFNSLKEKKLKFEENRIWNIFIQMLQALRYLHKEKGIVHRDLTPNNVMLGECDRVTITDFGLAKRNKSNQTGMMSMVGTILYSCPEIIKNEPYGEKTDLWALGCIVYEMCTLVPPFYSSNMLTLAKKIVEADYKPVTEGLYSTQLLGVISSCLSVKAEDRPDVLQLSAQVTDKMLLHIDLLQARENGLKKKLEKERRRTQKYVFEAVSNQQNYQKLFLASQEHFDHQVNSSANSSVKEDDFTDSINCDCNSVCRKERQLCQSASTAVTAADAIPEIDDQGAWTCDEDLCVSCSCNSSLNLCPQGGACCSANASQNDWLSDSSPDAPKSSTTNTRSINDSRVDSSFSSPNDNCHLPAQRHLNVNGATVHSHSSLPRYSPNSTTSQIRTERSQRQQQQKDPLSPLSLLIPNTVKSIEESGSPSPGSPAQANHSSPSEATHLGILKLDDSRNSNNFYPSSGSPVSNHVACGNQRGRRTGSAHAATAAAAASPATVTISHCRVRQVSDPILQLLHPLHKIIYITQLPPPLHPNKKRRVIEQFFKRALFSSQSTSDSLKKELKKLLNGSPELIDLGCGLTDGHFQGPNTLNFPGHSSGQMENGQKDGNEVSNCELIDCDIGVTYEQMQAIIEGALIESGYYHMPSLGTQFSSTPTRMNSSS